MGTRCLVAMPQWRHQHQTPGPGMGRLTSVTILPGFRRLSLYLFFPKSFRSQVSWRLRTTRTELSGNACPSERVWAPHPGYSTICCFVFPYLHFPSHGSCRGLWQLFLPVTCTVAMVVTSAVLGCFIRARAACPGRKKSCS